MKNNSARRFVLVLLSVVSVALVSCSEGAKAPAAAAPVAPQLSATNLVGKWLRADGGYVLEIRAASTDGKLDAGYFNPRPIHVSQATWRHSDELGLVVFIELTDTGYPGATYRIHLRTSDDKLVGAYTQPAAEQTFDVEFERQK